MHVCRTLALPDANGLQACLEWVVYSPTFLPPLTLEQATILGVGFWGILVVAKGFRELGYMIKKS